MLEDLIFALLEATTTKEKERAYKRLERVGVDRISADQMAKEFYSEYKGGTAE